jgi:putative transposase
MAEAERMKPSPDPQYRHRFPAEVISHAVWPYHVFSLSLRDVELLLAERGIVVSYETVRRRRKNFGESFANRLRCRRPRPGDKWHMDEVFIRIQGIQHTISGVPSINMVLSSTFSFRIGAMVAPPSASSGAFRMAGLQYAPRAIVTDKSRSYGVARRHLPPNVEHRQSQYHNVGPGHETMCAQQSRAGLRPV